MKPFKAYIKRGEKFVPVEVIANYDWPANAPACRIREGNGQESIMHQNETFTQADVDAAVEMKDMERLGPIVRAWESGARTVKEIALIADIPAAGLHPRLRECKRKGYVIEEKGGAK